MNVLKKLSTILFPNTEEPYQISDPTAVKFDAQELTEAQQMQARKNLGVYYKEGEKINIEWDGNTDGLEKVDITYDDGFTEAWYRVSPLILNNEQIKSGVVTLFPDGETIAVSKVWNEMESNGDVTEGFVYGPSVIFVREKNAVYENATFHETGVYFYMGEYGGAGNFTSDARTITPIPPEYLPGTFVPTAIIKSSDYDNALAGVSTMASDPEASDASYECINMTFEEAMQYVTEGRQLTVCLMFVLNSIPTISNASVQLVSENGERFLYAYTTGSSSFGLVWKSDGLTKN